MQLLRKKKEEKEKLPPSAENILADIHKKGKRRRGFWTIVISVTIFVCVVSVSLGFLIWSPLFTLKEVRVEGNRQIDKGEILSFVHKVILQRSWTNRLFGLGNYLVWPDKISGKDLRGFSSLKSISIKKDLKDKAVTITVEEREPYGIWCFPKSENSNCAWFDEGGIILERAPDAEGSLIPRVSDYTHDNLSLNSMILPANFLANLFSIFNVLEKARIAVKEIRIEDANLQEVKVATYEGPDVYFSLRFPADDTVAVLNSFLKGTADVPLASLQYVDFRVQNRAYYK